MLSQAREKRAPSARLHTADHRVAPKAPSDRQPRRRSDQYNVGVLSRVLAASDEDHVRLAAREQELAEREAEFDALKRDLHALQVRYLDEIGSHYGELSRLEAEVEAAEIRAGLRPPPTSMETDAAADEPGMPTPSCSSRSAPSDDLKRMFRDLAKAIHPDLAEDEPARCRRHSLMAEANRAYAERDEDRLRLILRAWAEHSDADILADPDLERQRVRRRLAAIDERLVAIEAERAALHVSAIWRLKGRIDDARAQGWDLFAEMILQVRREIARAERRLRQVAPMATSSATHAVQQPR